MSPHSLRERLRRWRRTFNTIRHLQPAQAWYFFLRRGIGARRIKPWQQSILRRTITVPETLQLQHSDGDYSAHAFNFLNRTIAFPLDAMNWNPTEAQRLWRYNLHYFDYLRDPARPFAQKCALIDDWITHNPQGREPAWEPYTASLRIVNWCLFFWSQPQAQLDTRWLHSLYDQARWLERNLELHILANHYFENIKALLFAALFFDDANSSRWLRKFQRELIAQLREQTLADGGHYERSPQYHCILLENYLDLYALFRANAAVPQTEIMAALRQAISGSLNFLACIVTPDDDIPLFNDSASGAASRPSAIFAKAKALDFSVEILHSTLINFPASGLFGWKTGGDYFLIDCGEIGPSYQPGHTHCDFLSFVLMIDKQWLVVDSGVSEYEPGPLRNYVRSTAAHNTVTIDNAEQSEIWGEFRVGRRAAGIEASIHRDGNTIIFEGAYRGFAAISAQIAHRRRAVLTLGANGNIRNLQIIDTVDGASDAIHSVKTLLHLHPSITPVATADDKKSIALKRTETDKIWLIGSNPIDIVLDKSWYCAQFGLSQTNPLLQLTVTSTLPVMLCYQIDCKRFAYSSR